MNESIKKVLPSYLILFKHTSPRLTFQFERAKNTFFPSLGNSTPFSPSVLVNVVAPGKLNLSKTGLILQERSSISRCINTFTLTILKTAYSSDLSIV